MKALSVRQPWATLIAQGVKTIELRTWTVKYRGPLLICSARALWKQQRLIVVDDTETLALGYQGARGVAIAIVDLADVRVARAQDTSRACIAPGDGHYAWVLRNPRGVKPHPVRGQLGLFHVPTDCVVLSDAAAR